MTAEVAHSTPDSRERVAALDERYARETGRVYLSGMQALVRLVIDQQRRDRRAARRIGTFVSGYPGSPLGSYDLALRQAKNILDGYGVLHVPAANEEMAATAIIGTQMLDQHPHREYEGVTAFWYGKGPGVDRSGDALKHGNFAGTSAHGAVVVLSGEDHEAKSSTMPFQDDYAFMGHGIPVLYPSSVAEFLEFGLHAVALSRFSGCWTALKLVAQLCDGGESVEVDPDRPQILLPELSLSNGQPWRKPAADFTFFPGLTIETERRLHYERHLAVRAYASANRLDRITARGGHDQLGIVTAGKSYADLRQALEDMGLGRDTDLAAAGIRLLKMGLIYPIDRQIVREFADGIDDILVIEEKRDFLEAQVKEALSGRPTRILGKYDESETKPLFPIHGGMDPDVITGVLGPRLLPLFAAGHAGVSARLAEIKASRSRTYDLLPMRTPNYCSGCPHNISTRLQEGEVAWGSPGCHSFASIIEQPERHIEAMTQYGGEGLPWIGLAPFTERDHMVQNVGDGSLFHSSYLNIRFAAAVGANLTFKILFNGSIANTGGQSPTAGKTVPETVKLLETEGVRRIALLTQEPRAYAGARFGQGTRIFDAVDLEAARTWLAEERGVTVLLYDGTCANERRRQQKRGLVPASNRFVLINEDVCENCGHCGALTNCMSLQKIETDFGPKTQVHQSSCNQDHSCLGGDCPSFTVVETAPNTGLLRPAPPPLDASDLPEPPRTRPTGLYRVYIPGVGGTGVVTVNALLAHAATMDGKRVLSYDQTGAAQKWGAVLSSLVIADDAHAAELHSNMVGVGRADFYFVLDEMGAASPANLAKCDASRTIAFVNTSVMPSGEMIRNVNLVASTSRMESAIDARTRRERNVHLPAQDMAERLFRDHLATNTLALGAAYQAGMLPISSTSIEAAIRLNGVSVEQNLQAFRYGRLAILDPERLAALTADGRADPVLATMIRLSAKAKLQHAELLAGFVGLPAETFRAIELRLAELIDYQGTRYAAFYAARIHEVAERESAAVGTAGPLTAAVARQLYKLMAYKDEYEVARLHLKEQYRSRLGALFAAPQRLSYMLHPPFLRALGLRRKIAVDARIGVPLFSLLRALRHLRGTPFDPFGYAKVRREERRLIRWYAALVRDSLARLGPGTLGLATELASVPELIRGYESIKLTAVAIAEQKAVELQDRLNRAADTQSEARIKEPA